LEHLVARTATNGSKTVQHGTNSPALITWQGQVTRWMSESGGEMINLAKGPAALDSDPIAMHRFDCSAASDLKQEFWKVNPGIDSELKGTPESPVYLHQVRLTSEGILLVLDHRDSTPCEFPQYSHGVLVQERIHRDAFPQHAHAARRRFLSYSPVRERREHLVIPYEKEHAEARTYDSLLKQNGKRFGRQ
jgi:hypothetical protein